MALRGNMPIKFVQGESYRYSIEFDTAGLTDSIQSVIFCSKKLGIQQNMTKSTGASENKYIYEFLPSATMNLPECVTTYDIVVNFSDGRVEIQTGVPLEVSKRFNPLTGV